MTSRGSRDRSTWVSRRRSPAFLGLAALLAALPGTAREIPAQLPDPDGKAGDATKPVKVYILAGQSNMVGMGDLTGARNIYTGVYLTPDPEELGAVGICEVYGCPQSFVTDQGELLYEVVLDEAAT